jgi:hypothetical protein
MAGGFGHKVAELPEDLAPHLLVFVVFRLLEKLPKLRVQIASAVFELQKPVHVIDAAADVTDFVFGDLAVAADQVEGGLDPVAQADKRDRGHFAEREAVRRHGVCVLEHDRTGFRYLLHVPRDVHENGDMPLAPEDTARTERIADTLIDAVFERDLVVRAVGVEAADLDHDDHKVGVFDRLAPVGGRPDGRGQVVILDHAGRERLHAPQLLLGRTHQGELRVRERGCRQNIAEQCLTKHDTARADHRNLL